MSKRRREAQPLWSDALEGPPDDAILPNLRGVAFWIPGPPVPKGRPRFSSRGGKARTYTPEKTRSYETHVRAHGEAAMRGAAPMTTPLKAVLRVHLPALKSGPKAERGALPTGRPDLDNVVKAILDALNGVVYVDDAQVVVLEATKDRRRPDQESGPGVFVLVQEHAT